MQDTILHYGPPLLTQQAADDALETIDFIAAAVRGYDAIDITNVLKPLWRRHLATWYGNLPLMTRQWYANASWTLVTIRSHWPLLDAVQRIATLQQWSMDLPYMLMMLDPVLAQAHAIETQESVRAGIAAARQQAQAASSSYASSAGSARNAVAREQEMTRSLQQHNDRMSYLTTGLMAAMSGRR